MSVQDIFDLQAVVFAAVWCCRIVALAVGVALFRFVSLRSTI